MLSRKLIPLFLQRKKTLVCPRVSSSSAKFSIRLSFGHIDITTVTLEMISLQSVELLAWRLRHNEPRSSPVRDSEKNELIQSPQTLPKNSHLDAQCSTRPAFGGVKSLTWFSHTEAPRWHCKRLLEEQLTESRDPMGAHYPR